jgi:hypothetical protein
MVKRYSLEMGVVIALFLVYTVCAVFLCVIGADYYKIATDSMRQNYDNRTSVLYVLEKVRQNDQLDSIKVDSVDGSDALVLTERQSGRNYQVWLFVKDGALYEGIFAPDVAPDVALCEKIMQMQSMDLTPDGANRQIINVAFTTTDGKMQEIDVMCRESVVGGA